MNNIKNNLNSLSESANDHAYFLEGTNDTVIILVHGWTSMPRRLLPLAKMFNKAGYWISLPLLKGHGDVPEKLIGIKWEEWLENVLDAIREIKKNKKIKNIFIGGSSAGGNLSILASLQISVDGILLLGVPAHLKNHVWVWFGSKIIPLFKKYTTKNYYPNGIGNKVKKVSYQYFPTKSVKESLKVIKASMRSLNKVKTPILIMQTSSDYLVAKYSPWIIYNKVKSEIKKLQWMQTKHSSHVPLKEEFKDYFYLIDNFIKEVTDKKNQL